jgi:hypothetical protein
MWRRYGDVFTVRDRPGGRPLVLFTRPEHAKEIFAATPSVPRGQGQRDPRPIMGEHSLLLQDGASTSAPGAADAGVQRPRAARLRALVDEVAATRSRGGAAARVPRLDRMNALTLEVILRVVFGVTDEQRWRSSGRASTAPSTSARRAARWGYPRCSASALEADGRRTPTRSTS